MCFGLGSCPYGVVSNLVLLSLFRRKGGQGPQILSSWRKYKFVPTATPSKVFGFRFLKKIFYLFIFRERRSKRERQGEKHGSVASHTPTTSHLVSSPGMCPDWESNQQPSHLRKNVQPTEPHQSGSDFSWWLLFHPWPSLLACLPACFYTHQWVESFFFLFHGRNSSSWL